MYGRGYNAGGLGFGPPVTPPIVKQLLIVNGIVFLLQQVMPQITLLGAVFPQLVVEKGFLWQPFSYMFLHGHLGHVAMNMFVLWMFGSQLALVWGTKRFLRFYLFCGTGAGVLIALYPYVLVGLGLPQNLMMPTLGASGAVYGVLLAYSLTWPDRTIMLIFPPVAFRAIWLIPLLFLMEFYFGGQNVSHIGHLGGVLMGWLWLRRSGDSARLLPTPTQLKYRWNRWRMRRRLRAVRREDEMRRRRFQGDDRTLH